MATSPVRKKIGDARTSLQKSAPNRARVKKKALGKTISGHTVRGVQRRKILAVSAPSVAKVAFLFYVTLVVVFLIAGAVIWNFAGSAGLILKLNHFVDQLIGSTTYHVSGLSVFVVFASFGIVWSVIATILTFVGVMLFNLAAEYIGGISVLVGLDDTNL